MIQNNYRKMNSSFYSMGSHPNNHNIFKFMYFIYL